MLSARCPPCSGTAAYSNTTVLPVALVTHHLTMLPALWPVTGNGTHHDARPMALVYSGRDILPQGVLHRKEPTAALQLQRVCTGHTGNQQGFHWLQFPLMHGQADDEPGRAVLRVSHMRPILCSRKGSHPCAGLQRDDDTGHAYELAGLRLVAMHMN